MEKEPKKTEKEPQGKKPNQKRNRKPNMAELSAVYEDVLYTRKEVADLLGMSVNGLHLWESQPHTNRPNLPFIRIGHKKTLYAAKDIKKFLEDSRLIGGEIC